MTKELNGSEIAGFVKERQLKAVRGLKQQWGVQPKLAIVRTNPDPVVDAYMKIKKTYGQDIEASVEVHTIDQSEALDVIQRLNQDASVHGIIVQIPLPDPSQSDEILNAVLPHKDVDGLSEGTKFDAPTPLAIVWLLAGYDVDLKSKNVVVIGQGRLVGKPLIHMLRSSGVDVTVVNSKTKDVSSVTLVADVIISGAGVPGLLKADMVKTGVVVVDAGVSTDNNGLIGDVDQSVRDMSDVSVTPQKGGVGPLTVSALFENVITAARKTITKTSSSSISEQE